MATDDDDDAATLRERVRELEATVAQQQETIQQLMPSRRAILAGGAGLVGGAALTGQASAQSVGSIGTSSEPVDVEAAEVNADSVNTASAEITSNIKFWDGEGAIQEAYDDLVANGQNILHVPTGSYSDLTITHPNIIIKGGSSPEIVEQTTTISDLTVDGSGSNNGRYNKLIDLEFVADQQTNAVEIVDTFAPRVVDCFDGTINIQKVVGGVVRGCSRLEVVLGSNAEQISVVGNSRCTITDNGTGNEVIGNT